MQPRCYYRANQNNKNIGVLAMKKSLLITSAIIVSCASSFSFAQDDAYQSTDLDEAIESARRVQAQAATSSKQSWYNQRSTVSSIKLPKLLNTEMSNLIVEGAMQPTAAGGVTGQQNNSSVTKASLGHTDADTTVADSAEVTNTKTQDVSEPLNFIYEVSYQGPNYTGSARGIQGNTRISARIEQ